MKKHSLFSARMISLMILMACYSTFAAAQDYIYINGPSTVCTNSIAYYQIGGYYQCSYQFSWSASQNGVSLGGGYGPNFSFSVGISTSPISISMSAYPYYGNNCYPTSGFKSVSVATGQTPGTPSAVSITHYSGFLYDLSTSSSGATSYEWTINSGATIQGSATGSTVRVLASGVNCYFSFQVRGKNTSCGAQYSSFVSGSKTIGPPAAPDYVSGPPYITNGGSATFTASNDPHDPGVFSWSLSDPGGALSLYPSGGTTATVYHSGSSSPLREAYVNLWRTSGCGTSAMVSALTRYGSNNFRMQSASTDDVFPMSLYPNPAENSTSVSVTLPGSKESSPQKIKVLDWSGKNVLDQSITKNAGESLEIKGLSKGMYTVQVIDSHNGSQLQRLIIK